MKRSNAKLTELPDGDYNMQIPNELARELGMPVPDPQKRKQEINRELSHIRKAVAHPATILPEVATFLDKHARKLEEELQLIEKRKV
jgi:hypothetical protein